MAAALAADERATAELAAAVAARAVAAVVADDEQATAELATAAQAAALLMPGYASMDSDEQWEVDMELLHEPRRTSVCGNRQPPPQRQRQQQQPSQCPPPPPPPPPAAAEAQAYAALGLAGLCPPVFIFSATPAPTAAERRARQQQLRRQPTIEWTQIRPSPDEQAVSPGGIQTGCWVGPLSRRVHVGGLLGPPALRHTQLTNLASLTNTACSGCGTTTCRAACRRGCSPPAAGALGLQTRSALLSRRQQQ